MKKLSHLGYSYNGYLGPDQFGFVLKPGYPFAVENMSEIVFPCQGGKFNRCILRITTEPADQAKSIFHWDGNMEEPTITPSIGCDHRCGWHGHLIKGEIQP